MSNRAVFVNHYQEMYCLSLIDMRSYRIRHSDVSRDKIREILNVNVEIQHIFILATKI